MKPLVREALCQRLEPSLPPRRRVRFPGRKPPDYRKILTGNRYSLWDSTRGPDW